jgi:hypothetical protein
MKRSIHLPVLLILFLLLLVPKNYSQNLRNYAGVFNGTSSYVAIPSQAEIAPTTAITIEAWVYPTAYTNWPTIVGKNYATSYWFGINEGGRLRFYPTGGAGNFFDGSVFIPSYQWTHVAATYDGTTTKLYVNGVCTDSSNAFSGPIGLNSDSLFIGCDRESSVDTYFFWGEMDNVRLWSVARLASDIASNRFLALNVWNPTGKYAGLAATYCFDEGGTSSTAGDLSGTINNNGTYYNLTFDNNSNKPVPYQDYNSSLVLDGNSYCSAPNMIDFNATTAITVEAWVKIDTTGGINTQEIVNKSGGTRTDWDLGFNYNGTNAVPFFEINTGAAIIYGGVIPKNKWTHLAATYNSANGVATLYINGDTVLTTVFTGNPLINDDPDSLVIGGVNNSAWPLDRFKGQIDEVRIWNNTVRTPQQIKDNMYNTFQAGGTTGFGRYCFDFYSNYLLTSGNSFVGNLNFNNNAFISSSKVQDPRYLTAPILFDPSLPFSSQNYLISTKRLSLATVSSVTTDSINVTNTGVINDIKLFILFNAVKVNRVTITLQSPNGTICTVTPALTSNNINDIMAVFDNTVSNVISYAAGSSLTSPFSPIIKPANSFAVFTGTPAQGWWKLSITGDGATDVSNCLVSGWGINPTIVTGINDNAQLPNKFELAQNYPNPFNPSTTIRYSIAKASLVTLKVYDILGREVATLVNNENKGAGTYSVEFNKPLASGIYIYKLQAGSYVESKKMILMK